MHGCVPIADASKANYSYSSVSGFRFTGMRGKSQLERSSILERNLVSSSPTGSRGKAVQSEAICVRAPIFRDGKCTD